MLWRTCAAVWLAAALWFGLPGAAASVPVPESSSAGKVPEETAAFLKSAEALYQASVQGSVPEIRKRVLETERRLRSLSMQGIASAEGIEALARSVARMKRVVASASGSSGDLRTPAAEIRLAADALARPGAPMWHEYRTVLLDDIHRLEEAMSEEGSPAAAKERLDSLKAHYGLIRTAVLLRSSPFVAERADSVIRYAERVLHANQPDPGLYDGLIPSLRESMEGLFPAQRESQAAAIVPVAGPPWGWSAFMGTFIVTVLSWVGWLRYRRADPVNPRGTLPPERREHR
ncbi:sporulation protein YpjB [Cohnella sp. CFH 77786]|uniref:sporulation protein YpjB n=1 Tax=Cohnella sp. CFH 77786 TaxID=2662265 RepID=UPI001C610E0D|nr:sporulation protein YpjB [Cohnella sp. CFH 77786]